MSRIRVTIVNTPDRSEELRRAATIRRDLWAHSPVEVDPDNPLHGTHRDEEGRAYFEFATDFPAEVQKILRDYHHETYAKLDEHPALLGQECANCGNIAGPFLPSVCPNCGFRDIAPCASCGREVSRQEYTRLGGDLFRCPRCQQQVRLRFNEPVFHADGTYRQPLVLVEGSLV